MTAWCFTFIPLALTAAASALSLMHYRRCGSKPGARFASIDLLALVAYVAILIPVWAVEIGKLEEPGFGLLAGYTTAPMIVNM